MPNQAYHRVFRTTDYLNFELSTHKKPANRQQLSLFDDGGLDEA
ncbi:MULTISPECIES: hypothetical protein [unclassified Halomonas]|nr:MULTISPECIES: hypothetical protein [unclassified Halomonas]